MVTVTSVVTITVRSLRVHIRSTVQEDILLPQGFLLLQASETAAGDKSDSSILAKTVSGLETRVDRVVPKIVPPTFNLTQSDMITVYWLQRTVINTTCISHR